MVKIISQMLPVIFIVLLFHACSSGSKEYSGSSSPRGKYNFTMYDSTGKTLLDVEMNVTGNDTSYYAGISITKKHNDFYSYGNMQSAKNYTFYNKKEKVLFINMNPSSTDDNIYITLNYNGKSLSGKWTHSTIAGEKGRGEFIAEKVK